MGTLRSDLLRSGRLLLLELLTNSHARGLDLLIGDRMRTVLTEELTGVVSKDVRISQDGLISFVLIGQFLEQFTSLDKLLIGLNQSVLDVTGVLVDDRCSIRAEVINNLKTCFAYSVGPQLIRSNLQRS